jgi:hypothetical protein
MVANITSLENQRDGAYKFEQIENSRVEFGWRKD